MEAPCFKPTVLVIGPLSSTGGMATAMRLQFAGTLVDKYNLIPLDNSKRTAPDRTYSQGIRAQLGIAFQLVHSLRHHRPDIVHIHTCSGPTFYRSVLDMFLAKWFRAKVILHIRGGRFEEFFYNTNWLSRRLVKYALSWADRVVALSHTWAQRFERYDSRIRLSVIHNGVALPARAKQWRETRNIRIVFVGNLRHEKGVDDLIEALAKLPQATRSRLKVRFIGPDPYNRLAELQEFVQRLDLVGVVEFAGVLSTEKVKRELASASVFVLPSYAEGLPNALLEAMAIGLPSVVSDVGAVPEVIDDGVEGLLVTPGDLEELTKYLMKLIRNPNLRKRLGRAARMRVRREFSQDHVEQLLDELYSEMLDKSGGVK